jgi:outer membrane receptor for ferrienterochelin and colicin
MSVLTNRTGASRRGRRTRKRLPMRFWLALCAGLSGSAEAATDLTALSLEQLLDVAIVGASKYEQKQSDVAAAVSVITRREIKTFGWRTIDEALASLPGVHLTYDRQYSYLGLRGFGLPGDLSTRVLVMVDGNRINDPVYDAGPVGREFPVDIDLIERIEFIPGPGGAVYGQNAMFGVVNVITRSGADLSQPARLGRRGLAEPAAVGQPGRLQPLWHDPGRQARRLDATLWPGTIVPGPGDDGVDVDARCRRGHRADGNAACARLCLVAR